jgi:hypothetical protein
MLSATATRTSPYERLALVGYAFPVFGRIVVIGVPGALKAMPLRGQQRKCWAS